MTYGRLIIRNLFRHPLRSLFTTLSIALSIFLVCAVLPTGNVGKTRYLMRLSAPALRADL